METFDYNKYEADRFSAKMYLETFAFDLNNSFEPSANKEIEKRNQKINELNRKIEKRNQEIEKLNNNYSQETKRKTEQKIIQIENWISNYYIDIEYMYDEVWALIEMKIIYAFKFLEINIKKLVSPIFSEAKTKDFYKWDKLNSFLQGKNIRPYELEGYQEVTQLKNINNSLKHSDQFNERIKKQIPEFKDKNNITSSDLNSFYLRIKDFPRIYLNELAYAILKELYEFDEQKINKIADNIAYRMDKNDAKLLITAIKSKY
ncbi:MAG: hypothetical protein ACOCP4_05720 [Candidatus Woesearchaeota archaeon]